MKKQIAMALLILAFLASFTSAYAEGSFFQNGKAVDEKKSSFTRFQKEDTAHAMVVAMKDSTEQEKKSLMEVLGRSLIGKGFVVVPKPSKSNPRVTRECVLTIDVVEQQKRYTLLCFTGGTTVTKLKKEEQSAKMNLAYYRVTEVDMLLKLIEFEFLSGSTGK